MPLFSLICNKHAALHMGGVLCNVSHEARRRRPYYYCCTSIQQQYIRGFRRADRQGGLQPRQAQAPTDNGTARACVVRLLLFTRLHTAAAAVTTNGCLAVNAAVRMYSLCTRCTLGTTLEWHGMLVSLRVKNCCFYEQTYIRCAASSCVVGDMDGCR